MQNKRSILSLATEIRQILLSISFKIQFEYFHYLFPFRILLKRPPLGSEFLAHFLDTHMHMFILSRTLHLLSLLCRPEELWQSQSPLQLSTSVWSEQFRCNCPAMKTRLSWIGGRNPNQRLLPCNIRPLANRLKIYLSGRENGFCLSIFHWARL